MKEIKVSRDGLSQKQIAFLDSQEDEVLFGGARGGGKTHVSRIGAVEDCLKMPGRNIIFVRPTIKSAREQFSTAAMSAIIPREVRDEETGDKFEIWKFDKNDSKYYFANGPDVYNPYDGGSVLILGGIEKLQDAQDSYQGIELVSVWWDELPKATDEAARYLVGSLRDSKYKTKFRATGNPGEKAHKEVKARYVTPWYKARKQLEAKGAVMYGKKVNDKYNNKIAWKKRIIDNVTGEEMFATFAYIPATLDDNPNENIRKSYLKTLLNQPEHYIKMYREGSWDVFEGKYWNGIDTERNFVNLPELKEFYDIDWEYEIANSKTFMSFDWGYQDYTAVYWHLETTKGVIVTYKEYYINQTTMEEIAANVQKMNDEMGIKPYAIYMPWDIYVDKGEKFKTGTGQLIGSQLVDVWRHNNQTMDIKASSDRKAGWANMTYALKKDIDFKKLVKQELNVTKIPMWLILKQECKHLKAQIDSAQIDPIRPEDIRKGTEDHALDACRMFWVAHIIDPKIKDRVEGPVEGTPAHYIKRLREQRAKEQEVYDNNSLFDTEW